LMTKDERYEMGQRNKLWDKVEKHGALMIGIGVKLVTGEEVVRIGQGDLRKLEEAQQERKKKWMAKHRPPPPFAKGRNSAADPTNPVDFDVNVVGVRSVTEKGRVRQKSHDVSFCNIFWAAKLNISRSS
jgi:hypothetical protein